jgi:cysteine desulfurase / selenocysteine lyase
VAIDVDMVRAETPGCLHRLHFNNAGASLMPRPVIDTVVEHLQLEARIGGYEAADAVRDRSEAVYTAAARLVGCQAPEIALFDNATHAWGAVFYAVPFGSGDRIVTGRAEYCSNYLAYLQVAQATGAEIVVIGDDEHGQISIDELQEVIDDRVKLISLSHVPTSGGLVNPAAQVGAVAREAGIPFMLDACQSVGQMPVDVHAIGCDFLAATGRKFLRAPRGTGFLYVNQDRIGGLHPAVVEVGGAAWTETGRYTLKDDARRFETWEASTALRLGLGQAIEYALDLGLPAIWDRVAALAGELRSRLRAIDGVAVHDLGRTKCGIVTFTVHGVKSEDLFSELRERAVNVDVSTPEDTRLDFEARRLSSLVRASVHYFNTDDEITRFCDLVAMLSRQA